MTFALLGFRTLFAAAYSALALCGVLLLGAARPRGTATCPAPSATTHRCVALSALSAGDWRDSASGLAIVPPVETRRQGAELA